MHYQVFFSVALVSVLGVIVGAVSKKTSLSHEMSTPFECGFVPTKNSRGGFSLQFFLVALVFLIFDVEIIILFPSLLNSLSSLTNFSAPFIVFVCILMFGLAVEWSQKSLEWMK